MITQSITVIYFLTMSKRSKIVYIDEEPISSKGNETLSKDEEEILEIMCLLQDPSFYAKCEEYDLQFANDIASSSRSQSRSQ